MPGKHRPETQEIVTFTLYRTYGGLVNVDVKTYGGKELRLTARRWQSVQWLEMVSLAQGIVEDLEGWEPRIEFGENDL